MAGIWIFLLLQASSCPHFSISRIPALLWRPWPSSNQHGDAQRSLCLGSPETPSAERASPQGGAPSSFVTPSRGRIIGGILAGESQSLSNRDCGGLHPNISIFPPSGLRAATTVQSQLGTGRAFPLRRRFAEPALRARRSASAPYSGEQDSGE
jgi:hypothetical protein